MDQVCEAPMIHGLMSRSEAENWARHLFKSLDLPELLPLSTLKERQR